MLPVLPQPVLVVVRADRAIDVRAAGTGLHGVECGVLERDHVIEELALLGGGLPDHHRSFQLGVVAPHRRPGAGHQDIAFPESDVVRERMRDGRVPPDLSAVAGLRTV